MRPNWCQRRHKAQGCLNKERWAGCFGRALKSAAAGYNLLTDGAAALAPPVGMPYDSINAFASGGRCILLRSSGHDHHERPYKSAAHA